MPRLPKMAAWALLACTCARDDAKRYQLDGLVVVEDFDQPICAGTFSYFERRLSALERETGMPRDPLGLIFYWIYERDEIPSHCGELAGACAEERVFYGQLWSFDHELAHAHVFRLGRPRVWLREGMATMLEDGFAGEPDPEVTPSDMLPIEDPRGLDYTAAGGFTVYLRDRYGMPRLLDYYAASDEADLASSVAIFRDIFGDDFAAVEADYLASDMSAAIGSLGCDVPEIAWSGEAWTHSFTLTCDDPATVGLQQDLDEPERSFLWSSVVMTAPPGGFTINLDAPGPAWVSIIRCDRPEAVFLWEDVTQVDVTLEGGRYLVTANTYVDTGSSATVTVGRLAEPPGLTAAFDGPPPGFMSHRAHHHRHE